jgi:hypothetical protein
VRLRLSGRLSVLLVAVLGVGVLPAVGMTSSASAARPPFTALRDFKPTGAKVRVEPRSYAATRVDLAALRAELAPATRDHAVRVAIPAPDGSLARFDVESTALMQAKLAAAHPEITTYSGRGVDDPRTTVALDITPMGFHAFVRGPGGRGAWAIDPAYNVRGTTTHLSYYESALPSGAQRRAEGEVRSIRSTIKAKQKADLAAGQLVTRRFYRLALTSDPAYADYFGTDNVLAEKVTLINRVNQIYNDDMAINLRLVNATDSLNLDTDAKAIEPNGPCGAHACFDPGYLDFCDLPTLGRNRTVLGQLVGASKYDIGHIALGVDGGGVAYLDVVGGDYKGGGCTGLPDPRGDFFAIDYVAHEMGHQFGGDHTFNGTLSNCAGGNRERTTSVEPGSGSSVMAYAGICRQDNLQPHTDPYFSQRTIDEVGAYTTSAPYGNVEVQTVSLRGFDTDGESITLDFPGSSGPITLTRGTDYDTADIEAAIETLTGLDVTVVQWGYDEVVDNPGDADDSGFQVIFTDEPSVFDPTPADVDLPSLTVTSSDAGVSGWVGETAQGGPSVQAGTTELTGNHAPSVTAPADKTLPMRTPFALTASGSDVDGDPLTYLWEQNDIGGATGTTLTNNTKLNGPLFRVFGVYADVTDEGTLQTPSPGENLADGNPTRVFPDMAQVLADNTNAETGACPAPPTPNTVPLPRATLDCYSEFLPMPGYVGTAGSTTPAMHFRVTARDGYPNGGGTSFDDVVLTLDPTKGPFAVTSQATPGGTAQGGTALPVTWSVNGTQTLAPNVRITMSTDGGKTWGQVLAASTPNDGSESVTVPDTPTTHARIRIEAVDNYFFDTNDAEFTVTAADKVAPDSSITSGPADGSIVLSKRVKFGVASTEAGSSFVCTLDELAVPCDATGASLKGLDDGTHVFSVAARDAAGNTDLSPATRTFTVPLDDPKLTREGHWKVVKKDSAFGGDYSTSNDKGDKLVKQISDVTKIVLVVSTGKNLGPVKVYVGSKLLKTVNLEGKNNTKVLKTVGTFAHPKSGKLKLVVGNNKEVRIEGVALVTTP